MFDNVENLMWKNLGKKKKTKSHRRINLPMPVLFLQDREDEYKTNLEKHN